MDSNEALLDTLMATIGESVFVPTPIPDVLVRLNLPKLAIVFV